MLHSLISLFHLYNFQPYLKLYSKLALIDVYLGIFLCFLLAWYKFSLFAISMTRLGRNFSKSHFYHVSRDKKNYHTHHTLPSQTSSPILCVSRLAQLNCPKCQSLVLVPDGPHVWAVGVRHSLESDMIGKSKLNRSGVSYVEYASFFKPALIERLIKRQSQMLHKNVSLK